MHNVHGGFGEGIRTFEDYSPTIRTPKGGGHLPMVMTNLEVLRKGEWGTGEKEEESFTLNTTAGSNFIINRIRRLTPKECERLQGFPDGWTEGVSDTQRYKQLGNAVTTNVITAIFTEVRK